MSRGNNRWIGLVIGVILPIIGVFGINQFQFPQLSFSEFLEHGWEVKAIGTWLRVAVLLNLLPFLFFMNTNKLRSAQGVFFGTIVHAAIVVYIMIVS